MMTIDEQSLRTLRTLTIEEIAALSVGGDVEAFEVVVLKENFIANRSLIETYLESRLGNRQHARRVETDKVIYFFNDPYTAFEFKINCG